jgi:hypothetical protein
LIRKRSPLISFGQTATPASKWQARFAKARIADSPDAMARFVADCSDLQNHVFQAQTNQSDMEWEPARAADPRRPDISW